MDETLITDVDRFLQMVRSSGLVPAKSLDQVVAELTQAAGGPLQDSRPLGKRLVDRQLITPWQNWHLLRGRFRGFFLGRYRLLSFLGSGGMSRVYLAEHQFLKRLVALKLLTPNSRDPGRLRRFHRESQASAALNHTNVRRVYDFDKEGAFYYLALEYIDGPDLARLVSEHGPLAFDQAADYIAQAADALAHVHSRQMVHRDVKPSNLMVDRQGTVKLLDLGVVRRLDDRDPSLTADSGVQLIGTVDYMPPEQFLDGHNVAPSADLYSLGCTLYYLLTGQAPFGRGTQTQRILRHQTEEPPAVYVHRPTTPHHLAVLCHRLLAKNPTDRPATALEVRDSLWDWLDQRHSSLELSQQSYPPAGPSTVHPVDGEECPAARQVFADWSLAAGRVAGEQPSRSSLSDRLDVGFGFSEAYAHPTFLPQLHRPTSDNPLASGQAGPPPGDTTASASEATPRDGGPGQISPCQDTSSQGTFSQGTFGDSPAGRDLGREQLGREQLGREQMGRERLSGPADGVSGLQGETSGQPAGEVGGNRPVTGLPQRCRDLDNLSGRDNRGDDCRSVRSACWAEEHPEGVWPADHMAETLRSTQLATLLVQTLPVPASQSAVRHLASLPCPSCGWGADSSVSFEEVTPFCPQCGEPRAEQTAPTERPAQPQLERRLHTVLIQAVRVIRQGAEDQLARLAESFLLPRPASWFAASYGPSRGARLARLYSRHLPELRCTLSEMFHNAARIPQQDWEILTFEASDPPTQLALTNPLNQPREELCFFAVRCGRRWWGPLAYVAEGFRFLQLPQDHRSRSRRAA